LIKITVQHDAKPVARPTPRLGASLMRARMPISTENAVRSPELVRIQILQKHW
jgi:hypothetical protein